MGQVPQSVGLQMNDQSQKGWVLRFVGFCINAVKNYLLKDEPVRLRWLIYPVSILLILQTIANPRDPWYTDYGAVFFHVTFGGIVIWDIYSWWKNRKNKRANSGELSPR